MGDKKSQMKAEEQAGGNAGEEQVEVEDQPELRAAAESVERAREQFRAAQESYRELCRQAEEKVKTLRGKTMGELIDTVLGAAKKHPVPSLLLAGFLGYFLGRLFRR